MENNEQQQDIVKDIIAFEKEEANMISLYQELLKIGIVKCLPHDKQVEFRQKLEKVLNDSLRHKEIMSRFLVKYKEKTYE